MSASPVPASHDVHADLLAVLRTGSTDARPNAGIVVPVPTPPGIDDFSADPLAVGLLPVATTSRDTRAVAVVLAGNDALVDAGPLAGAFTAGLLTALATRGSRVAVVGGSSTPAVRGELARFGLARLLGDAPGRQASAIPADTTPKNTRPQSSGPQNSGSQNSGPEDTGRLDELREQLQTIALRVHDPLAGDGPSLVAAIADLAALRARHLHPPLVATAASWTSEDRARFLEALRHRSSAKDSTTGPSDEEVDAVLPHLTALPGALERLSQLLDGFVTDLSWRRRPRTLQELHRALDLLRQVDDAQRTYLPLALGADLDQARAVLTRQHRSLLSAEERERRREVRRLAALRHDGSFGLADVEVLQDLQRAWAEHADGPPTTWPGSAELAGHLDNVHTALASTADVLAPQLTGPAGGPDAFDLAESGALSAAAQTLVSNAQARHARSTLPQDVLEDLVTALPSGASAAEADEFVRALWLRALVADRLASFDTEPLTADLVTEFRTLDAARRAHGARELATSLEDGRAPVVTTVATGSSVASASPDESPYDVLVVDDAQLRTGDEVAELAAQARQLVLIQTVAAAGADSAWARTALVLAPHHLVNAPVPTDDAVGVLRASLATAVRAAGLSAVEGATVAGEPVDVLVTGDTQGRTLALDLDASAADLPTVQDREVARPARWEAAGSGHHRVRTADWFRDPRSSTQQIVEAFRALPAPIPTPTPTPTPTPAPTPTPTPTPTASSLRTGQAAPAETQAPLAVPSGLGLLSDAEATVSAFVAGLDGSHPNVDHTPAAVVDAAVALGYARLGVSTGDTQVMDAAMDLLGFRRRGIKVLRAFKESLQRSKKRMRGAGVRIS
ncbi:MAG: hypothetical protein ACRYF3_07535 [Janthinobacterium lividum]